MARARSMYAEARVLPRIETAYYSNAMGTDISQLQFLSTTALHLFSVLRRGFCTLVLFIASGFKFSKQSPLITVIA